MIGVIRKEKWRHSKRWKRVIGVIGSKIGVIKPVQATFPSIVWILVLDARYRGEGNKGTVGGGTLCIRAGRLRNEIIKSQHTTTVLLTKPSTKNYKLSFKHILSFRVKAIPLKSLGFLKSRSYSFIFRRRATENVTNHMVDVRCVRFHELNVTNRDIPASSRIIRHKDAFQLSR